jgi:hypothetical protein
VACKDIAREVLGIPCGELGPDERWGVRVLTSMGASRYGKLRCLLDRLALREPYMMLGLASVGLPPVVLLFIYPYYLIPTPYLIAIGILYSLAVLITGWSIYYYATRRGEPTIVVITPRHLLTCDSPAMQKLINAITGLFFAIGGVKQIHYSNGEAEMKLWLGCNHTVRIGCFYRAFIIFIGGGNVYVGIEGLYKREIANILYAYIRRRPLDAIVNIYN